MGRWANEQSGSRADDGSNNEPFGWYFGRICHTISGLTGMEMAKRDYGQNDSSHRDLNGKIGINVHLCKSIHRGKLCANVEIKVLLVLP